MQQKTFLVWAMSCALTIAACSSSPQTTLSPSAVDPSDAALNPDGSSLKVDAPTGLGPNGVTARLKPTHTDLQCQHWAICPGWHSPMKWNCRTRRATSSTQESWGRRRVRSATPWKSICPPPSMCGSGGAREPASIRGHGQATPNSDRRAAVGGSSRGRGGPLGPRPGISTSRERLRLIPRAVVAALSAEWRAARSRARKLPSLRESSRLLRSLRPRLWNSRRS